MENNNSCCLADVARVIDVLQKNSSTSGFCDETCTRPFLGASPTPLCFNTRPITLYSCNGSQIETSYEIINGDTTTTGTSGVYRVESVDDCCVTCMVLAENPTTTDPNVPYIRTNTYITFNLNCACAIQCLPDVIVNNI